MARPEPDTALDVTPPADDLSAFAEARQRRYAMSRRQWADAVGRPYERKADPRPPPGELDAPADE